MCINNAMVAQPHCKPLLAAYTDPSQTPSMCLRRWVVDISQIVESVNKKALNVCELYRERSHELSQSRAHLAASVALHNFCI